MKSYSFIQEAEYLEEGRIKSTIAAILSLIGAGAASSVKLPASYVAKHPGETTIGRAMIYKMMEKPKHKVDITKEFTRGFTMARDEMFKKNPSLQKMDKLGNSMIKKSSFRDNVKDAFDGKVEL